MIGALRLNYSRIAGITAHNGSNMVKAFMYVPDMVKEFDFDFYNDQNQLYNNRVTLKLLKRNRACAEYVRLRNNLKKYLKNNNN